MQKLFIKILVIVILFLGIAYDALFAMVPDMGVRGYSGIILAIVLIAIILGVKKIVR